MKYAGLMKPPSQMTRDVYRHVLSQVSLLLIKECDKYISGSTSSVDPMEKKIKDMISDFRSSLDTKGTRDLFKEYKELMSYLGHFPSRMPRLKQKDFSGIKSRAVREQVKERLESPLDFSYERVHENYNFGNQSSTKWAEIKEELRGLVISPREDKKWFSVDLNEDWYLGAEKLEDHQEMVRQDLISVISEKEKEIVEYESQGYSTRRNHAFLRELKDLLDDFDNNLEAFKGIFVVVDGITKGDGKPRGSWENGKRTLSVYVKLPKNETDYPIVKVLQKEIWTIVVHEMTHFAQDLLTEVVRGNNQIMNGVEDAFGQPSKKIRTPEYSQHQGFEGLVNENHQLDDIEFYTNLRDAISDIMGRLDTYPSEDKVIYFKALTAQRQSKALTPPNPFFETLKREAPLKWKKAVGEAYKLVFNSFAHQRMAQRIASSHLKSL